MDELRRVDSDKMNYWEYTSKCKELYISPRSEAVFIQLLSPVYSLLSSLYNSPADLIMATNDIPADVLVSLIFYSKGHNNG